MKAYTSRARFDERRRFTAVQEQMGRVRLDADANEQAVLVRTDARRRSGDVAEGCPDDGFLATNLHLLDPIRTIAGWSGQGLPPDDQRVIPQQLGPVRRDPDTLPYVMRVRGYTRLVRTLPTPIDLLHLPIPLHPSALTYSAAALVLPVRFARPPTDDEIVDVGVVLLDVEGTARRVLEVEALSDTWAAVRVPLAALAALPRSVLADGVEALFITGWGFEGLPPRAEIFFDALLGEDTGLGDRDFILRGGDGTPAGAGRLYINGWRAFLEQDWRYSLQPELPDPQPLASPPAPDDWHYLAYLDLWERPVHAFQDPFILEPALDGDDTTFRSRKVTQIRVRQILPDGSERLLGPIGDGRLTTNIPSGALPDRFPPEDPDPCRDRCLFSENISVGEGYRGHDNVHFRVEILRTLAANPLLVWSRNNAATVAPLLQDGVASAESVVVAPADAARFQAGDIVLIEDERSRLDPDRDSNRPVLRRLRAVDTATGRLELHETGHLLTNDPNNLDAGGPLGRTFRVQDRAAVRRWDGADWLLTGVRYNLQDGITFALAGEDFRSSEYWSFTARIIHPDGAAHGVVEQLTAAPVHGPWHERVPLARLRWTAAGRVFEDLRVRFLPLHVVRDRLIELGRRHLSPGAFTVVVGDGVRTFGDIDQNLLEGVTGDEALQAALDRLGTAGGTLYIRAGTYRLEHPVLLQARSDVRILGDGDASELQVTGAGGAFVLDWCGHAGDVTLELLYLVESPQEETPIGGETLVGDLDATLGTTPGNNGGIRDAVPFVLSDLQVALPTVPDVFTAFAQRIPLLRSGEGRSAASVVRTITRLRRLQREHPGQPLEDIAAAELAVLRLLPHGVVTITDSSRVRLRHLTIDSREQGGASGLIAAGVLIAGTCVAIDVADCRINAPSGVVAAPYGQFLTPLALVPRPRSGLFVRTLTVVGNHLVSRGNGSFGIRIADGVLDGVAITGNYIDGFPIGLALEDSAELRLDEAVDRTVVRDNQILGATLIGLQVVGDGVDVEANEVRLAPGAAPLRAGVHVTGAANRIRQTWITLPAAPSTPVPAVLGLEAGILVGSGRNAGDLAQRPVHDLEIVDNRIEGPSAGSFACGIAIGGAQPMYDVRLRSNTLRNLGDAGIRAWGHSGALGRLHIEDNRIEGVARAYRSWGVTVVNAVTAMIPALAQVLDANATPRDVLEALLNQATRDVRPALDDMLRWLEAATLRGGIVLSLAEESQIRNNRIVEVGSRQLPPNFVLPGAEIRTAGIALTGGRDLVVEGNQVMQVQGAIEVLPDGGGGPVQPRPPILDFLNTFQLSTQLPRTPAEDIHGATVALRKRLMAYAAGTSRQRQRLGASLYAAMESVEAALEAQGAEAQRLARTLSGGISEMLEAQGAEAHTQAANLARAIVSDASRLTAADDPVAQVWTLAARFDHAILGDEEDVIAVATEISQNAVTLLQGLEELGLDLVGRANAVIAAQGSEAVRRRARLNLAEVLGTLGEARARKIAFQNALPTGGLGARESTVVEGMVRLTLDALGTEDPGPINEEELRRLEQGANALVDTLTGLHRELAERLRQDFRVVREARGTPDPAAVGRLRQVLDQIQQFARDPARGTQVSSADLDTQDRRLSAELVMLTAAQLDRRVGGLALESESDATRNLRLVRATVGQLGNLVANEPQLRARAREAEQAIAAAITDVDNRAQHQATARQRLIELQEEQGRLAGVGLRTDVTPIPGRTDATRLAGLGQLVLELRSMREPAQRQEGVTLFENHVRRATEELALRSSEREGLLRPIPAATAVLRQPASTDAEAAALHSFADILDRLSDLAARQPGAAPQTLAVRALNGTLVRALDPGADEQDRRSAVQRWVEAQREVLAASTSHALSTAGSTSTRVSAIFDALAGLTRIRPVRVFPVPLPAPRLRPLPADGLFAAGVQTQLSLSGNQVESTRLGAVVTGMSGHILAPAADDAGLALTVEGNQVVGGATGGIDVHLERTAFASLCGNHVLGCSGLAQPVGTDHGQAVVRIRGEGDLLVAGNRLHDNGTRQPDGLLHEVLIDWRGDATIQDNWLRHSGAGNGGAGLLIMAEDMTADVVRALAQRPALEVEVPPQRPPDISVVPGPALVLSDFLAAGLGAQTELLRGKGSFGVGGFRLATRDIRPGFTRLEAVPPVSPVTEVAEAQARLWLERPTVDRFNPLHDFLGRIPPRLILPRPRPRRALHVASNDIVAHGPALLLLTAGAALVSATVVGNELESSADTGAVYLRNLDTTVFSANRCECLTETNVVVIRSARSLLSITGNAVLGAQPPPPPPPPIRPFRPDIAPAGSLHLAFDLGAGSALTLQLDEAAVLQAIEQRQDTTSRNVVAAAEAAFNLFAQQQELEVNPAVRQLLASGTAGTFFRLRGGILAPLAAGESPAPETPLGRATAPGTVDDQVVQLALVTSNTILSAPTLSGAAKLFGIARNAGYSAHQARNLVQTQLVATGGVQEAALLTGLRDLTGVATEEPTVTESVARPNIMEEIVSLVLHNRDLVTLPPVRPPPVPPPPPDPRDFSLVILGGSRVGAINNVTTAGVYIHDAAQSIENNL